MQGNHSPKSALVQAKKKEKEYEWLLASKFYAKALADILKKENAPAAGELQEKIGFCLQNAAMQAESREEFREKIQHSIKAYEKASGFYETTANTQPDPRKLRCNAIIKCLGYWLISDPAGKRKLLDECLELESEALARFSEFENALEYGKTYNDLALVFFHRVFLEKDRKTLIGVLEKGVQWGEKAIADLSELSDALETARACFTLATCVSDAGFYFTSKSEDIDANRSVAVKHLNEAVGLSTKAGDALTLGLSHLWLGINTGEEEAARHHEKALEYGRQTRNNFLVAHSLDYLSYNKYWKARATEDPEKRRELAEEAMRFYEEAHRHYAIISFISPRGGFIGPPSGQAEHHYQLALWEPDPEKRRRLLAKSKKLGMEALNVAEASDMPMVIAQVLHVVSKTLLAQADIEPDMKKRKSFLEKALAYRERNISIMEHLTPFFYWNLGVFQNYLAGIEAELAEIEPDSNRKQQLFKKAALSKRKCLQLCEKVMPYFERKGETALFAALHNYQNTYATLQMRLYDLTSDQGHLRETIDALQEAVKSARKLDLVSLMAESHWKIARAQGAQGEHLKAAKSFANASKLYIEASEKIPPLRDFYHDHASYMQAWSEIEKARHRHANKQYGQAKEHYEKAADLHESTERWNYFSRNYRAWARLEEAEALSRNEQTQEATQLFQRAAELFREARSTLKTAVDGIEDADEKDLANRLITALGIRREYCLGRTALERAKTLGREGDNATSASEYGLAAKKFQEVLDIIEDDPSFTKETKAKDRREILPIIYLCKAWQTMKTAEAEASPELYLKASQLFLEAKEYSANENAKLLALGHSQFCRALDAGTKFEASRDSELYFAATQFLESAANYYVKAGFEIASEEAIATQRLFDAYFYVASAKKETDPGKKARHYIAAEKVLQTSTKSYLKARQPAKSEQVQRLLEKVREERELAVSLSEILSAPTVTSSTASFVTPTPSEETAVGLEKFEKGNIQGHLTLPEKAIPVGNHFNLELQIANAGKQTVLLDKIVDIIPQGFRLISQPDHYHLENMHLNLMGKRLAPLKFEEIGLVSRAYHRGIFKIQPKVIYMTEAGQQLESYLEPAELEVTKVVLPKRIPTGYENLDDVLLGGIPENYAVILTSPVIDEVDLLVKRFLATGAKAGQITFLITTKVMELASLAKGTPSNFYLFVCNPQADVINKGLPNIFKLKGVENLTDISITLTSALRKLSPAVEARPRRCCIQIVSDVLLQHKALQTRKWLMGLLPELKSLGFTVLAVMDPQMHSTQEVRAVLDLFEGEIDIYTKQGVGKLLKIKRMAEQEYLETEIVLNESTS